MGWMGWMGLPTCPAPAGVSEWGCELPPLPWAGGSIPRGRSAVLGLCPAMEMLLPDGTETQKLLEIPPAMLSGAEDPGLGAQPAGMDTERDSGCVPRSLSGNSRRFGAGFFFQAGSRSPEEPERPCPCRELHRAGAVPGARRGDAMYRPRERREQPDSAPARRGGTRPGPPGARREAGPAWWGPV